MKNFVERRDAVSRIDPVFVRDRRARWLARVVVDVEAVNLRAGNHLEPGEVRTAFENVIDVRQQTRVRMPGFDGDERYLTKTREVFRKAPDFDLRDDANTAADIEQRVVAFCRVEQVELHVAGRSGGWRGDVCSAKIADKRHLHLCLLECLLPFLVIVDDPVGKADRAFDFQTVTVALLPQLADLAAVLDVGLDFANPRLDPVVAGFRCEVNFLIERNFLSANCARVEAIAKFRRISFWGSVDVSGRRSEGSSGKTGGEESAAGQGIGH